MLVEGHGINGDLFQRLGYPIEQRQNLDFVLVIRHAPFSFSGALFSFSWAYRNDDEPDNHPNLSA
jgi:hypothetical protein